MKFLVFFIALRIFLNSFIQCEVIFTSDNPLAKPDPAGLGFVKFIFNKNLAIPFDSKKYFDSGITRAVRTYISARNSSLNNLNLTSKCESSLTALLNNFDIVFNYNGTINVFRPEFWSLKGIFQRIASVNKLSILIHLSFSF